MATLKELNLRVASLVNTQKITSAMKLIATTKLTKAQARLRNADDYFSVLKKTGHSLFSNNEFKHNLLKNKKQVKKVKVFLITSDRGLCSAFNINVIKKASLFLNELNSLGVTKISFEFFGKKGYDYFSKHQKQYTNFYYEDFFKTFNYYESKKVMLKAIKDFYADNFDEVYVIYNFFQSTLVQVPVIQRVLPFLFEDSQSKYSNIEKENTSNQFLSYEKQIFEPNQKEVIDEVVNRMIQFQFYYTFLNSFAGEHGARMTAMDNATTNCNDMINKCTLERNRVRQASITNELIEIISGAESIN